jgi:hypothetical protein
VTTSPARTSTRRTLLPPVALCIILIPLAQFALGIVSLKSASLWPWLAGTPVAYFLIGALGAFLAAHGLTSAQARWRGSLVGVSVGVGGGLIATLIVAGYAIWLIAAPSQPQSDLALPHHPSPVSIISGLATWSPTLPAILLVIFFMPFFLAANLLGVGLAALGGLLGGAVRGYLTRRGASERWQPGVTEETGSRGANIALIVVLAALGALLLIAVGVALISGASSLVSAALALHALHHSLQPASIV